MRKSDEQELIRLRSYRQHQDLIIEEQAQKIAQLEAELSRAKSAIAQFVTHGDLQKQIDEIERRTEKEKRAFMRHYTKQIEKMTIGFKESLDKIGKNHARYSDVGASLIDSYLKRHPGTDFGSGEERRMVDGIVGLLYERIERMRLKKGKKLSEVL